MITFGNVSLSYDTFAKTMDFLDQNVEKPLALSNIARVSRTGREMSDHITQPELLQAIETLSNHDGGQVRHWGHRMKISADDFANLDGNVKKAIGTQIFQEIKKDTISIRRLAQRDFANHPDGRVRESSAHLLAKHVNAGTMTHAALMSNLYAEHPSTIVQDAVAIQLVQAIERDDVSVSLLLSDKITGHSSQAVRDAGEQKLIEYLLRGRANLADERTLPRYSGLLDDRESKIEGFTNHPSDTVKTLFEQRNNKTGLQYYAISRSIAKNEGVDLDEMNQLIDCGILNASRFDTIDDVTKFVFALEAELNNTQQLILNQLDEPVSGVLLPVSEEFAGASARYNQWQDNHPSAS